MLVEPLTTAVALRVIQSGVRNALDKWSDSRVGASSSARVVLDVVDYNDLPALSREGDVAAAAPVMPTVLVRPVPGSSSAVSPPASSWGIEAVGATRSSFDGRSVVVAVLDTGIDATHEAFDGVTIEQKDFTGQGPSDGNGHGTHCAGTIVGRDVSGERIGVARGVRDLIVGKVLADDGAGDSKMILDGLLWAMQSGANVISLSLGLDFPGLVRQLCDDGWPPDLATSRALEAYRGNLMMFEATTQLIHTARHFEGGAVVVAAAGNESRRPSFAIGTGLPAATERVLAVGAVGPAAGTGMPIARFSNRNPDLVAPGVDIRSARTGGGLRPLSGTSMACPHVAGVAALWWQAISAEGQSPRQQADVVRAKLLAMARKTVLDPSVDINDRGVGLVTAP